MNGDSNSWSSRHRISGANSNSIPSHSPRPRAPILAFFGCALLRSRAWRVHSPMCPVDCGPHVASEYSIHHKCKQTLKQTSSARGSPKVLLTLCPLQAVPQGPLSGLAALLPSPPGASDRRDLSVPPAGRLEGGRLGWARPSAGQPGYGPTHRAPSPDSEGVISESPSGDDNPHDGKSRRAEGRARAMSAHGSSSCPRPRRDRGRRLRAGQTRIARTCLRTPGQSAPD